jgi:hypothetical protein
MKQEWNADRRAKYDGRRKQDQHMRNRYGISLEQYEILLEVQDHKCAICKDECLSGRNLAVDHCHESGRVRGLLCVNCNIGLGNFRDSSKLLMQAIDYLGEG